MIVELIINGEQQNETNRHRRVCVCLFVCLLIGQMPNSYLDSMAATSHLYCVDEYKQISAY